jgi:hypothetical protein
MTQGVLLFAQNNGTVDYVKMAVFCANRIKKFLNMPVSLVTDSPEAITDADVFDQIIVIDSPESNNIKYFHDGAETKSKLVWKNQARSTCYSLTPYDETLVVDVDYVVNSDFLLYCWQQPHDFLIYQKSFDLAQSRDYSEFQRIGNYSIPFYWATVFWFRKTPEMEHFFTLVSHVKENWSYYKLLYQITSTNFRNDYAFSIAIHMMNGFTNGNFVVKMPKKLFYTMDTDFLVKIKNGTMQFLVQKKDNPLEYLPIVISNIDVHIMNKFSLLRHIDNE